MSLQQAQDLGLAPLASGEFRARTGDADVAPPGEAADDVAQMVSRHTYTVAS